MCAGQSGQKVSLEDTSSRKSSLLLRANCSQLPELQVLLTPLLAVIACFVLEAIYIITAYRTVKAKY